MCCTGSLLENFCEILLWAGGPGGRFFNGLVLKNLKRDASKQNEVQLNQLDNAKEEGI